MTTADKYPGTWKEIEGLDGFDDDTGETVRTAIEIRDRGRVAATRELIATGLEGTEPYGGDDGAYVAWRIARAVRTDDALDARVRAAAEAAFRPRVPATSTALALAIADAVQRTANEMIWGPGDPDYPTPAAFMDGVLRELGATWVATPAPDGLS